MDGHDARRLAKEVACRMPVLRDHFIARYPYLFSPAQLAYLCSCLNETRDVAGCVVEAGCYQGQTTLYLNHHMTVERIEKPYWAIDTFSGYRTDDLDDEAARGQKREYYRRLFTVNEKRWFDLAMRRDGVTRVRSIVADIGAYDFARLAPIAFCLIDVIFYRPTQLALPRIWDALSPGGVVVVTVRAYLP